MKKEVSLIALIVLNLVVLAGGPGNSWAWGEHEVEAKGNWMNMEKLVQQKKYDDAVPKVVWLLEHTPDLNVALYINAIKVYEKRARREKLASKRMALEDSVLFLYDRRVELFGDEAKVLNRKGKVAYDYLGEREGKTDELFGLYTNIYKLNGLQTYPENAARYVQTACKSYLNKGITKEMIFQVYNESTQVFDAHLAAEKDQKDIERIEKYKSYADQLFAANVEVSCEDIQQQFGTRISQTPDLNTAKIIVSLSVANKCYSNEAFVQAGEYMVAQGQTNYSLQKIMSVVYVKNDAPDKAKDALRKGIELESDSTKQAAFYLEIAEIEKSQGNKVEARSNALKATELNVNLKEAYSLVGDLYFQSSNQCATDNKVQSRAVYIAAYNMYQKAGNTNGAAAAKAQFPSMEEMFLYNQQPGQSVNTGCWIGESVVLQQR